MARRRRSIILPRRSSLGQRLASLLSFSIRSLHPETRLTGGLFITGDASRKNNYLPEVEASDFRLPPEVSTELLCSSSVNFILVEIVVDRRCGESLVYFSATESIFDEISR